MADCVFRIVELQFASRAGFTAEFPSVLDRLSGECSSWFFSACHSGCFGVAVGFSFRFGSTPNLIGSILKKRKAGKGCASRRFPTVNPHKLA